MPRLHRPTSLDDACALLDSLSDPVVYGGGTAIQILIKQGLLFAENLVDISGVPGLDRIEETETGFRVGSMVTIRRVETDVRIRARSPLAAEAYGQVANPRVRNTATVGGNLAHGDYRLDPPTALMVLNASVEVTSTRGVRTLPVREFFVGFQTTALEPGEMITAIDIPASPAASGWGYVKMSSLAENDWPVASVAALIEPPGLQAVLRIGIGALAPTPRYVEVGISGLDLKLGLEAGLGAVEPLLDPLPDVRGSEQYKRRLGLVASEDAVTRAWKVGNHE